MPELRHALPPVASSCWFLFAAQSAYYAAGGRWGASAFPPSYVRPVLNGDDRWRAVLWAAALAKAAVGAAVLAHARQPRPRVATWAGWLVVILAAGYEGVASWIQHLAMLSGLIATPAALGHRSLLWHVYLFDPYWTASGVLLAAVLTGRCAEVGRLRGTRCLS